MNIEKIYIPLLDEGTPVLRPTNGEIMAKNIYKVLPIENYDPTDEHWMFPPGKIVKCKKMTKQGKVILVAVKEYQAKLRPLSRERVRLKEQLIFAPLTPPAYN